jgi:hypothetical protein
LRLASCALTLCAVLLVTFHAAAQRDEEVVYPPCREVRNFDAMQYWFWDAYFGHVDVHDFTHERWGRLGIDPSICFRIALVVVEDTGLKSAGYRQAVTELLQWVGEEGDSDDDDARRAAAQLEKITGEDFDTLAEWADWWERSEPFVMWSEDEDRLVVMTEAQEAGETVHEDALALDAEEYWFYAGRGWISESEPVGEFVFGSVTIPPHDFYFRVRAEDLQARDAKERGYRRALDNLFVDGLLLPELRGDRLDRAIDQIARLTGESLPDRESWVTWWQQNRDRLALAPAGDHLVVRQ